MQPANELTQLALLEQGILAQLSIASVIILALLEQGILAQLSITNVIILALLEQGILAQLFITKCNNFIINKTRHTDTTIYN